MPYHYARALLVGQAIVGVHPGLVLGEEHGVRHLAYVVVECARAHEQTVGPYLVGYLGGKVAHRYRMLERAGGYLAEVAQKAAVGV